MSNQKRRVAPLLVALLALALGPASSALADTRECRSECRTEHRECRYAARADAKDCKLACAPGDRDCRRACRDEYRFARAECNEARIGCAITRTDGVDLACADGCLAGFDLCRGDKGACLVDCRDTALEEIRGCIASGAGRECIRDARAAARECASVCHETLPCFGELRECVQGCVVAPATP